VQTFFREWRYVRYFVVQAEEDKEQQQDASKQQDAYRQRLALLFPWLKARDSQGGGKNGRDSEAP
jgi:hypothetical protein